MRINEILTESQLQQLEEGPKLDAFGRGVGKFVGGVAKGVGALAGGVAGAGRALKKGFQSGRAVVGDDPDPNAGAPGYTDPVEPAPRTANTAPAPGATAPAGGAAAGSVAVPEPSPSGAAEPAGGAAAAPSTTTPPSAADINAQGPKGSAPAKAQTGDAGRALARSTAVVDKTQAQNQEKANQTVYAQVKANVDKLDKKGKQRILQMLQKSMSMPAPGAAPKAGAAAPKSAADPAAAAAAKRAGAKAAPGAGAFANMANTLSQDKTEPAEPGAVSGFKGFGKQAAAATAPKPAAASDGQKMTPAQQAAMKAKLQGKRAAGQTAGTTASGFKGAVAGAKAKGIATASKTNHGNALSEALARQIDVHKQKMFETGLARGTVSVLRK